MNATHIYNNSSTSVLTSILMALFAWSRVYPFVLVVFFLTSNSLLLLLFLRFHYPEFMLNSASIILMTSYNVVAVLQQWYPFDKTMCSAVWWCEVMVYFLSVAPITRFLPRHACLHLKTIEKISVNNRPSPISNKCSHTHTQYSS